MPMQVNVICLCKSTQYAYASQCNMPMQVNSSPRIALRFLASQGKSHKSLLVPASQQKSIQVSEDPRKTNHNHGKSASAVHKC